MTYELETSLSKKQHVLWVTNRKVVASIPTFMKMEWSVLQMNVEDIRVFHALKTSTFICYEQIFSLHENDSLQLLIKQAQKWSIPIVSFVRSKEMEKEALSFGVSTVIYIDDEDDIMQQKMKQMITQSDLKLKNSIYDSVTTAYSRSLLPFILKHCFLDERHVSQPFSFVLCEVSPLQQQGIDYEQSFVMFIKKQLRTRDLVIRWGDGQFLLFLFDLKKKHLKAVLTRIAKKYYEQSEDEFRVFMMASPLMSAVQDVEQYVNKMNIALQAFKKNNKRRFQVQLLIPKIEETVKETFRIAIIQRDAFTEKLLVNYLKRINPEHSDIEMRAFENGAQFLNDEWSRSEHPYLVLIDTNATQMSAVEFVTRLRKSYPKSQYAVFVLTNRVNDAELVHLLQQGIDDYIVKPFSVEELLTKLKQIIIGDIT
ncbi:response regulator [Massilibacterium senegalense]|uniref:response regulator n=1 Tax=Massilibacterium senegalense TaxID=1632858 RepID=UPI000781077A|nr:response regulator [Massilibacterium senegalense]